MCAPWASVGKTFHVNAAFFVAMLTMTVRRSHAQVYDFPTLVSYTNYSACVQQQPGRTLSATFEVWKVRNSQASLVQEIVLLVY